MTDVLLSAPGRCHLDPATTTVEFATRHLFGLAAVRGTLAVRSGEVDVGDPIGASVVQVELDAASFSTGNPRRDQTVRGRRYLAADAHPTLIFASHRVDGDVLSGTLTVRGVTRPVRLQITDVVADADGFGVDAVTRIDRFAFGITASRGLASRYLQVTVHTRVVHDQETTG